MGKKVLSRVLCAFLACILTVTAVDTPVFASEYSAQEYSAVNTGNEMNDEGLKQESDVNIQGLDDSDSVVESEGEDDLHNAGIPEGNMSANGKQSEEDLSANEGITEEDLSANEGITEEDLSTDEEIAEEDLSVNEEITEEAELASVTSGNFQYNIISESEKTAKIVGYADGTVTGGLVIPSTLDGYTVTTIGSGAFSNHPKIYGPLTLPNTVTVIEDSAFYGCYNLTGQLVIPEGVTKIGMSAFEYCGFTGAVTIPDSVTYFGNYAIMNILTLESHHSNS